MPPSVASDPFEDALASVPDDDPFEAALSEVPEQGDANLAGATANAQTQSFGFADELQAAAETVPYAIGEAAAGRFELADVVDYYKYRRDDYRKETGQLAQSNPTATAVGTGVGIATQLAGVNPVSVGRGLLTGGRALLSGTPGAINAVRGAAAGAAYGGVAAAGSSEADLTEGEIGDFAGDVAEGAGTGAKVGLVAGALLGPAERALAGRTAAAGEKAAAAQAAERDQALLKTGLEGKQRKRPDVAKQRAQAVLDEPMPGDPSKKLFDESEKLSPDDRYALAKGLRQEQGEVLGSVRKDLAKSQGIEVPAAPIREKIRGAFDDLPAEVQAKALEQVDAMIGAASKDGALTPAAVRKLIEDSEGLAKYGSPTTDNLLGNARKRVFQTARAAFVEEEKALVQKVLPQRANEYDEALRKYAVYSDFEEGARVKFERANKGQRQTREPKREAPSGTRALLSRTVAGEIGARAGALLPIPGSTYAGAKLGEAIADKWLLWTGPSPASLSAKVKKLERLKPMMEQALAEGPAEVAKVHALFMAKSPDYRKAIESGE